MKYGHVRNRPAAELTSASRPISTNLPTWANGSKQSLRLSPLRTLLLSLGAVVIAT
jgi:hypothetical protein